MIKNKVITVRFQDDDNSAFSRERKCYAYFCDEDLNVDDYVIVKVNDLYKVAVVHQTIGLTSNQIKKATKWIVQVIDSAAHDKRIAEAAAVQEIENLMESRMEQHQKYALYQALAQKDHP